jgi:hypothetical protein
MGLIFSDGVTKDLDVVVKEQEYINYIVEHISNVMKAYNHILKGRIFDPVDIEFEDSTSLKLTPEDMTEIVNCLEPVIKEHDQSKFSNEEFIPYRMHFHMTDAEKKKAAEDEEYANELEDAFEKAWQHHYLNNNHHTKYWMYEQKDGEIVKLDAPKPMDVPAILHMICDWSGMSLKFRNGFSPISWYKTADEKFEMHPNSRKVCEYFLNILFDDKL